jgi:PadR family transcriptional regulator, regulatory protein PadR
LVADSVQVQLRKGVLEVCVLALLSRADGYAYDIASQLAEDIGMGEGTIYPLMRRMQGDGLVKTYLEESATGPSRKYYQLTKAGRTALAAQSAEWMSFAKSVSNILADIKSQASNLPTMKVIGADA